MSEWVTPQKILFIVEIKLEFELNGNSVGVDLNPSSVPNFILK
jgi:hypothetical protein